MNMKEMTMEDIRKRITYRQEGDFLVPNIGLPEKEENQPELRKVRDDAEKLSEGETTFRYTRVW